MTYEQWVEKYRPIVNTINPDFLDGPFNGTMFETYGPELEFVRAACMATPGTVWTLLDCDGQESIGSGYHHVNRAGYFITEVPLTESEFLDIDL